MKAKLLKQPMQVKVHSIENMLYPYPDCVNPDYCPIHDKEFEAITHATWYIDDRAFVAILKDEVRLVVPSSYLSPFAVKDVFNNVEDDYIRCVDDVERYGTNAFVEDLLLMNNQFEVSVNSVKKNSMRYMTINTDFKWQLHGHIKPVKGIQQYVCFSQDDSSDIMYL